MDGDLQICEKKKTLDRQKPQRTHKPVSKKLPHKIFIAAVNSVWILNGEMD